MDNVSNAINPTVQHLSTALATYALIQIARLAVIAPLVFVRPADQITKTSMESAKEAVKYLIVWPVIRTILECAYNAWISTT